MTPLVLWSCACAVVLLSVVDAAPRSYRYDDYANAVRVKRQASATPTTTTAPMTINDCMSELDWPVECEDCPTYTVKASDSYSCLPCSQFCETCVQDPPTTAEDGSIVYATSTDCVDCMEGYLGELELDAATGTNKTVCYSCAAYCTGCMVKGECDSDKCISKSSGQGTIYDPSTKTCKACASNCKACTALGECDSGACFDGYAFNSDTKKCDVCPEFCTNCAYEAGVLKCSACIAEYIVKEDQTGCERCVDSCHECERSSSGSIQCKQDKCYDRHVIDSSGSCESCGDHCTSCSVSGFCDEGTCMEGYVYVQEGTNNYGSCNACPAQCSSCTPDADGTLTTCDKCMETFQLSEEPTCDFCPDNCFSCQLQANGERWCKSNGCESQYAYRSTDGTCHACPKNCKACSWNTGLEKTKCNSGSTGCISGFATRSADGECYECPDNCDRCTDTGSNTECDYNYCRAKSAYKKVDKTCPPCPDNCDKCYVDQFENIKCSKCSDRYVPNEDALSCVQCTDNCKQCEYVVAEGAALCFDDQCEDGYYRTDSGTCAGCNNGCAKCALDDTGSLVCFTCNTRFVLNNDNQCSECENCKGTCTYNAVDGGRAECSECNDNYALYAADGTCVPCPSDCQKCTTTDGSTVTCMTGGCSNGFAQIESTICVACPAGAATCGVNAIAADQSDCDTGFVFNGGVCLPCPDNCDACTFDTTTAETTCTTCSEGYVVVDATGLCAACQSGCTTCDTNGAGKCDSGCPAGYTLDTDTCAKCPSHCTACTTKSECGTCDTGYRKTTANLCEACTPNNCDECTADKNVCTACSLGYVGTTDGLECRLCPSNCRFCSIDGSKTKCNWGQCEVGYTMNTQHECKPCPGGCGSCHYVDGALTCYDGGCKHGFAQYPAVPFTDNPEKELFSCIGCVSPCSVCVAESSSTTKCDGCDRGFYGETCATPCSDIHANCVACTGGSCTKCAAGYRLDNPTTCTACTDTTNCDTCDATGACTLCKDTFFLFEGDCTDASTCASYTANSCTCADGEYLTDAGACADCDATKCSTCSGSATTCLTCAVGVTGVPACTTVCTAPAVTAGCIQCDADQAHCEVCDTGFYHDSGAGTCTACDDTNCATCSSASAGDCTSCTYGNHLAGGACTNTCAAGLHAGCIECTADVCTKCDDLYMLDSEGICQVVCDAGNKYMKFEVGATPYSVCEPAAAAANCIVAVINTVNEAAQEVCYENFCSPGYTWRDDIEACEGCDSNCYNCYWDDAAAETVCLATGCQRYYGRKADGTCGPCPLGCETCTWDGDTVTCDTCKSTHVEIVGPKCVACLHGCGQCSLSTLNEVKCSVAQCNDRYTQLPTTDQSCFPNPSNCKTGVYTTDGTSRSVCTLNQCVDGYAMNPADLTCHACPPRCSQCVYDATTTTKTKCDKEKCEDGNAQNPDTYECIACPARCRLCEYDASATSSVACLSGGCVLGSMEVVDAGFITCVECEQNCDFCMEDPTNPTSTICLGHQCDVGFGISPGRMCVACSEGCERCEVSDDGTTTCTSCSTYFVLEAGSCIACPDNCQQCRYDGTTSVTNCNGNSCDVGFAQNTGTARFECEACPDKCTQCTYGTSSTICVDNKCEAGFDVAVDGTCGACSTNCVSCLVAGPGKCDECVTGYRVSSEKLCDKCSNNCKKCSSSGKGKCDSSQCDSGYTHDDNNECKACSSNCYQCKTNGPGKCDTNKCDAEFAFANEGCLPCPDKCLECDVSATDGVTTECKDKRCYTGYGRKFTDKKCHKCPNDCTACEDTNEDGVLKCTQCNSYFILNSGVCGACPINCKTCSYISEEGLSCNSCQDKFTFDPNNNCVACPSNCDSCKWDTTLSKTVCDDGECDDGFGKDDTGSCKRCSSLVYTACSECTDTVLSNGNSSAVPSMCTECDDGYTMADDMSACLTCQISPTSNCDTCYDRPGKYCTECSSGTLLSESKEVCGVVCHKCMGPDCETFSSIPSSQLDSEVCDACWVGMRTESGTTEYARGCNFHVNQTECTSLYQQEQCQNANGVDVCHQCCTGTNCNSFDLTGSGAAHLASVCLTAAMLLFILQAVF